LDATTLAPPASPPTRTGVSGAKRNIAQYPLEGTALGETRSSTGTTPTDYLYTGQRLEAEIGLYFYNARFYDAKLGRFTQADTIIPGAGNVLTLDRYAYVQNNSLRYNDPSGHYYIEDPDGGRYFPLPQQRQPLPPPTNPTESQMIEYIASFGLTLQGNWSSTLLANLWEALFTHIGYKSIPFWLNGRTATLKNGGVGDCDNGKYYGLTSGNSITFYANNTISPVINILHEFGHLVDNLWNDYFTNSLENETFTLNGKYLSGWNGGKYVSLPSSGENNIRFSALISGKAGGGDAWQQRGGTPHWEDWADIFANGEIGNISLSTDLGGQLGNFY